MQGSDSYEWLLDSCLQECRKGISRLEQIAAGAEQKGGWLEQDLEELQALETAALHSFAALRRSSEKPDYTRNLTQEKLDRLQTKLLESFHHLASDGLTSRCP
jgi:hypothetical protein